VVRPAALAVAERPDDPPRAANDVAGNPEVARGRPRDDDRLEHVPQDEDEKEDAEGGEEEIRHPRGSSHVAREGREGARGGGAGLGAERRKGGKRSSRYWVNWIDSTIARSASWSVAWRFGSGATPCPAS